MVTSAAAASSGVAAEALKIIAINVTIVMIIDNFVQGNNAMAGGEVDDESEYSGVRMFVMRSKR